MEQTYDYDDNVLLFGERNSAVDTIPLHPDAAQIFRLLQLFLENVNPLLKVVHAPTLQGRVIEAASDMVNVTPTLEALLFAIYLMATYSLDEQKCQTLLGASKEDLMARFRLGCQQALFKAKFLQANDRDCLTALFLYFVSN